LGPNSKNVDRLTFVAHGFIHAFVLSNLNIFIVAIDWSVVNQSIVDIGERPNKEDVRFAKGVGVLIGGGCEVKVR
jgi:hypothetical protein